MKLGRAMDSIAFPIAGSRISSNSPSKPGPTSPRRPSPLAPRVGLTTPCVRMDGAPASRAKSRCARSKRTRSRRSCTTSPRNSIARIWPIHAMCNRWPVPRGVAARSRRRWPCAIGAQQAASRCAFPRRDARSRARERARADECHTASDRRWPTSRAQLGCGLRVVLRAYVCGDFFRLRSVAYPPAPLIRRPCPPFHGRANGDPCQPPTDDGQHSGTSSRKKRLLFR